ncbi:hypothetical protein [Novosphingobium sp. KACC 22771]|uniref:hypothetical protein n=1 Tax=Novosphingobium sp. KACC 22771 TaxID=3025670 RepID=UPI0023651719|nr:hypothetical protein [Novosphingobium sp. KACC 22771]WDF73937.1 hypothetical protein PQ467_07860 [Novosphingobium sp. KACC 22771]
MANPFLDHRAAACYFLTVPPFEVGEGPLYGGLALRRAPVADKQENWPSTLLQRYGLPQYGLKAIEVAL